jgi:hypothetical protein
VATFTDDFNRPDSTNLGAGWVEVSGDWSIIGGQLAPDTSSGNTILRGTTPMDSSDHYAQVAIAATTAASQGVWCRGDSTLNSGYLWRTNGSSWDLFAVVGGSFTNIGTYTAPVAAGDVAKVQAVGSTIKCFVNGIERVSVANTDVTTGVNVGLRIMALPGLRYDNFTAGDITAGATLPTVSSTETAQALTATKTSAPAVATETSSAQPLTGAKTGTLPPAADQNAAQALAGTKTATLGAATTLEAPQPITPTLLAVLPAATTDEAAQRLSGVKTATLTPALEVDAARPLTTQSTDMPSPEHTVQIPAEDRRLIVAAEERTLTVR